MPWCSVGFQGLWRLRHTDVDLINIGHGVVFVIWHMRHCIDATLTSWRWISQKHVGYSWRHGHLMSTQKPANTSYTQLQYPVVSRNSTFSIDESKGGRSDDVIARLGLLSARIYPSMQINRELMISYRQTVLDHWVYMHFHTWSAALQIQFFGIAYKLQEQSRGEGRMIRLQL